jgi:putative sugar O-methyltransferase
MVFTLKGYVMLNHNETLFNSFKRESINSNYNSSEYWSNYVENIIKEIELGKLSDFGSNYQLTYGFGDAIKVMPMRKLRKIINSPKVLHFLEKWIGIYRFNLKKRTTFSTFDKAISNREFLGKLTQEINLVTNSLDIRRHYYVGKNKVPFRYLLAVIYIEMINHLFSVPDGVFSSERIFSGNFMDIGGGYGAFCDSVSMYKRFNGFVGGINYVLDQFPVAYIANQYLSKRHPDSTISPVINRASVKSPATPPGNGHFFRVVQSNAADDFVGEKISLFFNSNSFQEMEAEQVTKYCALIRSNAVRGGCLAVFLYNSTEKRNNPKNVLSILDGNFKRAAEISSQDFFEERGVCLSPHMLKGSMYLYQL